MATLTAEHAVWVDQRIISMAESMYQAQQIKEQIFKEKELAKLRQKNTKIISAFRSNDMFRLRYPRISIIKKLIPYFKAKMNYSSRKRQHEFNEYT